MEKEELFYELVKVFWEYFQKRYESGLNPGWEVIYCRCCGITASTGTQFGTVKGYDYFTRKPVYEWHDTTPECKDCGSRKFVGLEEMLMGTDAEDSVKTFDEGVKTFSEKLDTNYEKFFISLKPVHNRMSELCSEWLGLTFQDRVEVIEHYRILRDDFKRKKDEISDIIGKYPFHLSTSDL